MVLLFQANCPMMKTIERNFIINFIFFRSGLIVMGDLSKKKKGKGLIVMGDLPKKEKKCLKGTS